jgi:predicted DNA-binding transcriptional regulator AlpA
LARQRFGDIIESRGLRREHAAHYVGISPASFDKLVDEGKMPRPKKMMERIVLWDRRALDQSLDQLFDGTHGECSNNPYDEISLKRPSR